MADSTASASPAPPVHEKIMAKFAEQIQAAIAKPSRADFNGSRPCGATREKATKELAKR